MVYTQLCSIPVVFMYAMDAECVFKGKILQHFWLFYASFSILALIPMGLIAFAIILHMENSNVTIHIKSILTFGLEIVVTNKKLQ